MNEDEESQPGEVKPDRAGWVRVEPTVRPSPKSLPPERAARLDSSLVEWEREFMPVSPKGKDWSYCVNVKEWTLERN